jgi:hypothetical protein
MYLNEYYYINLYNFEYVHVISLNIHKWINNHFNHFYDYIKMYDINFFPIIF